MKKILGKTDAKPKNKDIRYVVYFLWLPKTKTYNGLKERRWFEHYIVKEQYNDKTIDYWTIGWEKIETDVWHNVSSSDRGKN